MDSKPPALKLLSCIMQHIDLVFYVIFGVLSTLANILVYWVCAQALRLPVMVATVLAWIAAVLFAYVTNRRLVFHSTATGSGEIVRELIRFLLSRVATGLVDWVGMLVLVVFLHLPDVITKTLLNFVVIVLNFVASKLVVFARAREG